MALRVDSHPSVAIIKSRDTEEFLFERYNDNYPALPYRLASNTMGGNPKGDLSPFHTWEREIYEEFNNQPPAGEKLRDDITPFAQLEDIVKIRTAILENAIAYADFYFTTPGLRKEDYLRGLGQGLTEESMQAILPEKKRKEVLETGMILRPAAAIFSVFYSQIPTEEIERVKYYLAKGQRLTTEGVNRILTTTQLIAGIEGEKERNKAYLTAHCTPFILQDFLGLSESLDHLPGDNAVRLSIPVRATYIAYKQDLAFEYNVRFR